MYINHILPEVLGALPGRNEQTSRGKFHKARNLVGVIIDRASSALGESHAGPSQADVTLRSPVLDLLQVLIHRLRDDLVAEIHRRLIVRRGYHVAESCGRVVSVGSSR